MGTASHYRTGGAREGEDRSEKKEEEVLPESQSSGRNENHQSIGSVGGAREDKRTTESFPSTKLD